MIEFIDVSKRFKLTGKQRKQSPDSPKEVAAVEGFSARCVPGRITVLLGPNGAGKTTLLRMVATLMRPNSGKILVDDLDTARDSANARSHIGFQTGSTGLYERLSARETIEYFGKLNGLKGDELRSRTETLLDELEIRSFADRRVGKLSTGMKQRVSIARTIVHDPQVLVFDEATSGLDILASRGIVELVRKCRDQGKTVLFSTHRMDEASILADDLLVMAKGRLLYQGPFDGYVDDRDGRVLESAFLRTLEAVQ